MSEITMRSFPFSQHAFTRLARRCRSKICQVGRLTKYSRYSTNPTELTRTHVICIGTGHGDNDIIVRNAHLSKVNTIQTGMYFGFL